MGGADRGVPPEVSRILVSLAALVVIIAGLRAAAPLLVPFLCAVIFAVLVAPPVFWLHRRRVPLWLAVLAALLLLVGAEIGIAMLVGSSFNDFIVALPTYQQQLGEIFSGLLVRLGERGVDTSRLSPAVLFDPGKVMALTATLLSGATGVLSNSVLIFFTVVFLLLEVAGFPAKLRVAFGHEVSLDKFTRFVFSLNRYMVIKTATSLATGVATALLLVILNIPFALLWGVVTFFLHFVPNIGSLIAAIPPVLLALITGGPDRAILVIAGALAINLIIGNFVEPRSMGRGLGLSTLVVFISLVFWGWLFGLVGMLLAVPLTMGCKIFLEISPSTRWIAVLLGEEIASPPS